MSSVVFVVGGILEKSLRDLVVGAKASMLLDKTANGENQLTNVFDLDSVIVRDGGNLTLAPNTVLHVSSLVVGHDSSEVIPVISKIIVTTHATFKIKTSMKLFANGKIEGKGLGYAPCQNGVGNCDNLKDVARHENAFDPLNHAKITHVKGMGGTHGGIGGHRSGWLQDHRCRGQEECGRWGDPICVGDSEQDVSLICGPGVEVGERCNCTLYGYGDFRRPQFPGSAGQSAQGIGGSGGAALNVEVAPASTVEIQGVIDMSGSDGQDVASGSPGGGGAGGSISFECADGSCSFAGAGALVADGGRGGVGADQTGNNNYDDPFRNHGGGGGGGRIGILKFGANTFTGTLSAAGGGSFVHDAGKYGYKLWQACSDEFRATNVGDSMVSGLLIPTPACALSRRMPAFATGGGGAGTVFVYNAADAAGELMINNDGMTPDHPTRVTNTPGAYNMTLGRLQLRGNASISVAAAEVSAGSSMTLQVGAFDDFEGCRVRLEAQTVLLINAGELEAPTSSIKTTQSLRTPSEFTRQISMVFYVGGRASLRSHLIVSEGAMLVVPPILSLTARARLQIWGRLRATQLFMREAAEIELFPTASTDESTGPNTFSFESVNVVDDARLILYNASSLIASLVTVGGPEGAPAGTITVNGRVYLETPTFEVHVTGVVDGRGRGYGASRGPGKSIADNGGGSHGGLGGQLNRGVYCLNYFKSDNTPCADWLACANIAVAACVKIWLLAKAVVSLL